MAAKQQRKPRPRSEGSTGNAGGSKAARYGRLLLATAKSWLEHRVPLLGAALAFYTIFAIAPLFVIVLAIAGLWFGEEAARRQLFDELRTLVGNEGGRALESVISSSRQSPEAGGATVFALITLFVGATGVFAQLQESLNMVWNLRPKPGRSIRRFVKVRLLSFAMVLVIGFLLLVSLVLNAAIAAFGKYLSDWVPGVELLWQGVTLVLSIGVVTVLFAMMFKVLPDAQIAWRDVWVGALLTALLFSIGRFLLSLYLGKSSIGSVYGAAGSLVIILMWVYVSSQIFLFGAEFTRLYAIQCGSALHPEPGAHFVKVEEAKAPKPGPEELDRLGADREGVAGRKK